MGEKSNFKILNNNDQHNIIRSFLNEAGEKTEAIHIQALASDAERADELNTNIIILDEIHEYKMWLE